MPPLLGGECTRLFGCLAIVGRRLEPATQQAIDAVEVEIDHRCDVKRQDLRHAQSADDRDTERLAQFGASAGARQTSVRMAGSDAIHGVSGLTAFGVGANPASWVDTAYFTVEPKEVASVDIANASGSYTLERTDDGWKVLVNGTPLVVPADKDLFLDHIDKIVAKVSRINLAEPGDPKRAVDKPQATVTIRMKPPAAPDSDTVVEVGTTVAELVATLATLLTMVFLWLVERPRIQRYVFAFLPAGQRAGARSAWNDVELRLGLWVRGQLTLMATMGVMTGIAYSLLGVPGALLLALIAAITEAISARVRMPGA